MAKRSEIYKALLAQGWQLLAWDVPELHLCHAGQPTTIARLGHKYLAWELQISKIHADGSQEAISRVLCRYSLSGINIAGSEISFTEPPKLTYAGPNGLFVPGA